MRAGGGGPFPGLELGELSERLGKAPESIWKGSRKKPTTEQNVPKAVPLCCWRRRGRVELLRPSSVGAAKIKQEFADLFLACVQLDAEWHQTVLKVLANHGPQADHSVDVKRTEVSLPKSNPYPPRRLSPTI